MINKGSAKAYCSESIDLIENYDEAINDDSSTWDLHHRRELTEDGEFAYSREDLKKLKLYYNRPADELIFLTESVHRSLHRKGSNNPFYGKTRSDESRAKMSEAKKGKKLSAEHRAKIAESMMGKNKGKNLSAETRAKISEAQKGKTVSAETKQKVSDSLKKYWQNRRKKKET